MVDFNLQSELHSMRTEQRLDKSELTTRIDTGFNKVHSEVSNVNSTLAAHIIADTEAQKKVEKRLDGIEGLTDQIKWLVRLLSGATVLFILDLVLNHLKTAATAVSAIK